MSWRAELAKNKGNDLFRAGRYEDALDAFNDAIKEDPSDYVSFSNRCAALIKLERWQEVIKDTTACLKLNPQHAKSFVRRAQAKFNLENYTEALQDAKKALKLAGKHKESMLKLKAECEAILQGGAPNADAAAEIVPPSPDEQPRKPPNAAVLDITSASPPKSAAKAAKEEVRKEENEATVPPPLPLPLPLQSPTLAVATPIPVDAAPVADLPLPIPSPSIHAETASSTAVEFPPAPEEEKEQTQETQADAEAPASSEMAQEEVISDDEEMEPEESPIVKELEALGSEVSCNMGRKSAAGVKVLTDALKKFPHQAKWLLSLGMAKREMGKIGDAILDLTAALKLNESQQEVDHEQLRMVCLARSRARYNLGDYRGAAHDASTAYKYAGNNHSGQQECSLALHNAMNKLKQVKSGAGEPEVVDYGDGRQIQDVTEKFGGLDEVTTAAESAEQCIEVGVERSRIALIYKAKMEKEIAEYGAAARERNAERRKRNEARALRRAALGVWIERIYIPIRVINRPEEPVEEQEEVDLYLQGLSNLNAKQYDTAITCFNSALSSSEELQNNPSFYLKRAAAYAGQSNWQSALEDCELAGQKAQPESAWSAVWFELHLLKSKVYNGQGKLVKAQEELELAEQLDLTAGQREAVGKRIRALVEKMAKAPGYAANVTGTGGVIGSSSSRAQTNRTSNISIPQGQGGVSKHAGKEAAAPLIEEVVPLDAEGAVDGESGGWYNIRTDHLPGAAAISAEEEAAYKELAEVRLSAGDQLFREGNIEGAAREYIYAIQFSGDSNPEPYCKLATIHASRGEWKDVEKYASSALAIDSNSGKARRLRAKAFEEQGNKLMALMDYSHLDTEFGDASAREDVYRLTKAIIRSGEMPPEALIEMLGSDMSVKAVAAAKEELECVDGNGLASLLKDEFVVDDEVFRKLGAYAFDMAGPSKVR